VVAQEAEELELLVELEVHKDIQVVHPQTPEQVEEEVQAVQDLLQDPTLVLLLMEGLADYPFNYLHHIEIFQELDIQVPQEHIGLLEVVLELMVVLLKAVDQVLKQLRHNPIVVVEVVVVEHTPLLEELVVPEL
jgi:hypothetical protein